MNVFLNSAYNKIKNNSNSNYTSGIVFYLNGQELNSGTLIWNNDLYNPIFTLQYDYNLTGFNINTLGFISGDDSNYYDYFPANNQKVFTGYSYSGTGAAGSLLTGRSGNNLLFFNGVKLFSGINYIQSGTGYYITSLYSGETGNLSIITIPNEFLYKSGNSNNTAIFPGFKFPNGWDLAYLNGIRSYTNDRYINISNKDMLSGSGNFLGEYISTPIYQNSDLFFTD